MLFWRSLVRLHSANVTAPSVRDYFNLGKSHHKCYSSLWKNFLLWHLGCAFFGSIDCISSLTRAANKLSGRREAPKKSIMLGTRQTLSICLSVYLHGNQGHKGSGDQSDLQSVFIRIQLEAKRTWWTQTLPSLISDAQEKRRPRLI